MDRCCCVRNVAGFGRFSTVDSATLFSTSQPNRENRCPERHHTHDTDPYRTISFTNYRPVSVCGIPHSRHMKFVR